MSGMRPAGFRVQHHFAITMISGQQHAAANLAQSDFYLSDSVINSLHGLDRRSEASGMADHVRVGEVTDDQIVRAALNRADKPPGQLWCGHFRLQVVCPYFGRGHHDPVLTLKHLLTATVQEESNVRVFLGFGHTQLGEAHVGNCLPKSIGQIQRREQHGQERVQRACIARHACGSSEFKRSRTDKISEMRVKQAGQEFTHPVGTEIRRKQNISVFNAVITRHYGRRDEFVCLTGCIGSVYLRERIGSTISFRFRNDFVGLFHTVPAIVAVHGVEAPGECGNFCSVWKIGQQALHIATGAFWRRVPAIKKGMDQNVDTGSRQDMGESSDMGLMRMHTARGRKTK